MRAFQRRVTRRAEYVEVSQASQETPQAAPEVSSTSQITGSKVVSTAAKEKVMELIGQGYNNYNQGELPGAVEELLLNCPIPKDQLAARSFTLGQGTWEVFYAPHIATMSKAMFTQFQPLQYVLSGDKIASHAKYSNALGEGWLSAAGSMGRKYDDTVDISFNQFWVDKVDALRLDVPEDAGTSDTGDKVVGAIGRGAFFPQFAVFPVLYLDEDICVFKFPALNSIICCRRVPTAGLITEYATAA